MHYDDEGRLDKVTDLEGRETTYTYRGTTSDITSITLPGGAQYSYSYSDSGLLLSAVSDTGVTSTYTYDTYGNPDGNPFANAAGAEGFGQGPFSGFHHFSGFGGNGGQSRTYRSPDGTTYYYTSTGGNGADFGGGGFDASGFGDMFGDLFGHMGGGAKSYRTGGFGGSGASGFGGGFGGSGFGTGTSYADEADARAAADVNAILTVPYTTAALGGTVRLKLSGGSTIELKIPAGTQCGQKIRLKGKGRPIPGQPGQNGDMYAEVKIEVPKNLTPDQIRVLTELHQKGL